MIFYSLLQFITLPKDCVVPDYDSKKGCCYCLFIIYKYNIVCPGNRFFAPC